MDTTSNISKETSYLTTCFIFDFQEHVFVKVIKTHLSGASRAGARKVHFPDFYKGMFRKSKMTHVVKYDVCLGVNTCKYT